jgi:hypothetical protein
VAGALGFLIGSTIKSRGTGPVIIAAVLGLAVSIRASREASESDDRETHSTD